MLGSSKDITGGLNDMVRGTHVNRPNSVSYYPMMVNYGLSR